MDAVTPVYKDQILVGGGHSHDQVLKMWAMKPLPGIRLTLVSPQVLSPYSGMLPGLISGHYRFEETHIDLARLCRFADARYIQAAVTGIDLRLKEIKFAGRTAMGFDVLSINAGIGPDLRTPGAEEFATPVKPIAEFYPHWQTLREELRRDVDKDVASEGYTEPYRIAIVGGGAAGVELVLAMHFSLSGDKQITRPLEFRLIQKGQGLPENYPSGLQRRVAKLFTRHQIKVSSNTWVKGVSRRSLQSAKCEDIAFDTLFWCAHARAPSWLKETDLELDQQGFIAVNHYLQSSSHDFVFAAGDIAQQQYVERPRAGVFAVRQGPILYQNLRSALLKQPLKAFRPQKTFLSLLACGERYALGCRAGSVLPAFFGGKWVWGWKNRIDQKFMERFSELPSLPMSAGIQPVSEAISSAYHNTELPGFAMRCGGCGAKVGALILNRVMKSLKPVTHDGVILGLQTPDDASAIRIPPEQLLVQSVDVFRALLDDPYLLGQISAQHALSDIFAMNAVPHSALAIATLPYAGETIVERDLLQVMTGALEVLNENGCALIGGHTSEGAELSLGFSVNGVCSPAQLLHKSQPQIGDKLILTQALGTGTLFAAHTLLKARGPWITAAIESMLQSNRQAGAIFYDHDASACTDITGFGLLGHLMEMLKPCGHGATITLAHLPVLDGAIECFGQGISSSLQAQNIRVRRSIADIESWDEDPVCPLLFDPQTSGGLLASVPANDADTCLEALRKAGYGRACVIGTIITADNDENRQVFLQ